MNLYSLLTRFFECQTRLVCRFPALFLALSMAITICLVIAAVQMGQINGSKQSLEMFLPDTMQSLKDLQKMLQLFPPRDAIHDSYSLFGSSFAYVIFEDTSVSAPGDGNVLSAKKLSQVSSLHRTVLNDVRTNDGKRFGDVCFREEQNATCSQHPVMMALEDEQAGLAIRLLARYPTLRLSGTVSVDNAILFGGVSVSRSRIDRSGNAAIERARAIRLFYVLQNTNEAMEWMRTFIKTMSQLHLDGASLYYTSSVSLPDEMERNGELLLPWIPWMIGSLLLFCALICAKWDPVHSQPFVGLGAMFNAFLAIVSATATLIAIEYPFLHMILIMPFLILSIGVDNAFLMLRSWRALLNRRRALRLNNVLSADAIFVEAIAEVSVSIFVTSLTDGLSFAIGTFSDFMAVRVFCTYCWLAILFMFLYQLTFFTALMALHCRREAADRHWLFCTARPRRSPSSSSPPDSGGCCLSYHSLASLLQHPFTAFLTLLLYFAYLSAAFRWIAQLELGLDLKLLTPDNSYVASELRAQERLFADYGAFAFCVIYTDRLRLFERDQRLKLIELYDRMSSGPLTSKGDFWLSAFDASPYSAELHWDDGEQFNSLLVRFLHDPQYAKYRSDIHLVNGTGQIGAIKMSIRIRKLGPKNDEPRAEFFRTSLAQSGFDGFVYDTSFLLVDQQNVTRRNMVANVVVAIGVMLLISALFVPRPMACLSVALCILSINVGVIGALSAAKTRLDIVSMITIVMSIGLSFDYATHITFHFLLHRENRVENTLRSVAVPILQAALSTALGVSVLAVVPSYMVRTFVLTVLFVVSLGLLHALFFLPVLLHFAVPNSEFLAGHTSELGIRVLNELALHRIKTTSKTSGDRRISSVVYFY